MKRLIYLSRAHPSLRKPHINDILATSREQNRRNDITGLLIHHEGVFFQILEGDRDDVAACFARICTDWRHRDCHILMDKLIDVRAFGDWAMAYRLGEELGDREVRQLMDISDVAKRSREGDLIQSPDMNIYLQAFLENFRMLDAS